MRPRELVVRGFRSYAEEHRFCWDGRTFVGIVGPIGSGKSSILDAVSFALYGKTPRFERDTKSLINQRRDALQVALVFDVDGKTYKAVRSLRRGGASAHALYRVDDTEEVALSDRARDMGEQVESLLGLDFDAFRRSVLLPQNQFSGFLEATPAERDTVLKGVFDFGRLDLIREEVQRRLGELDRTLERLAERRASAEADRAELAIKRVELDHAEERAATLEALRAPFEEVRERIAAGARLCDEARAVLSRLDGLADRIPDQDRTDRIFTAATLAAETVAAAEQSLGDAQRVRSEAAEAVEGVVAPVGGREGLVVVGDLVAAWRAARDRAAESVEKAEAARSALEAEERRVGDLEIRVQEAVLEAEAAVEEERRTAEELVVTRSVLDRAHQEHRAHALRSDLSVGDTCPVCRQVVVTLPAESAPAAVGDAEARVEAAARARDVAQAAARSAAERLAGLRAELTSAIEGADAASRVAAEAAEQRVASEQASAAAADAVSIRLGPGDPVESLEDLRRRVHEAEAVLEEAVKHEEASRRLLEAERRAADAAETALGSLRAELATFAGHLEAEVEIGESAESIREALTALRTEWMERRAAADAALAEACAEAEAARLARVELLEAAGLGASDDVAEIIAAAVAERSAKEAEVGLLEKRLEDLERLDSDEADLAASAALLRTLKEDLTPARFLRFLLEERRRMLADLASEHFEVLSAGRYRFDDSGDFQVVDLTAADLIRGAASLSGGETFLASLALALALAEIVSREGGRLDAFFLDEGFGSLDLEHLDLAMDGIERLVSSGRDRLVVVVSHVQAMSERIEDLIVLDRDATTGDTRLVAGSGCA